MSVRISPPGAVPAGAPRAMSTRSTRLLITGTWRTMRPVYVTSPSPCMLDCPAGTDVRAFLALAAKGDVEGAWHTIRRHNPFPAVCGRVCYHPCELACNRGSFDARVNIQAVERAIAAEARRRRLDPEPIDGPEQVRRVGIVGAGPAGLSCGYHLARRGYPVSVFDEHNEPGGMLRYGIPAYRLPRHVLDGEIALLRRMGVTFVNGVRVGVTGAPDLSSFAAIFLAIGAQRARPPRLPGDALPGIVSGLELLRDANSGIAPPMIGRVLVVGGGNTAIDAARVALRLGAEPLVLYRRSSEDMPAHPDEVAQAAAEGVQFMNWVAPTRFIEGHGRVAGVELQRMRPGEPDASGRPRPEPLPHSSFTLSADYVVTAIGEEVEADAVAAFVHAERGRLQADRWGRTQHPPVFAGGDAATGAGTVAEAIGSGRRAAEAIHARLEDAPLDSAEIGDPPVRVGDLNLFYFRPAPRLTPHVQRSARGFDEVVAGLGWQDAMKEAARCFTCGDCTACDNCYVFCPDAAITPDRETGTYAIDLAHCKGCGLCAAECPRGALALVPETGR